MTARPLRAASADLATLCTGGPCLLLLGTVEATGLDLPGIALWRASPVPGEPGTLGLHPADAAPETGMVALPGLPAGLLGILAEDMAAAEALRDAWGDPATAPPVIAAGPDALPALARLLAQALGARLAEVAALQDGLVRLREEAEAVREAVAALQQAMGHQPAQAPSLALSAEPAAEVRVEAAVETGGLVLAQRLGMSLEGIAAIGLHVAEARLGGPLVVRLVGEESGRARAAWRVPAAALQPGWLSLDLPAPLGPVRETAVLEVLAETRAGQFLALSLEAAEAPPERCPALGAGRAPSGRALAMRVWTAAFGRRVVLSPHWDWEAQDLPPAVPQRLPEAAWAAARVVAGQGGGVALGELGPVRPMVALDPGAPPALVVLPAVPAAGIDLIEAELAVRLGEAGALEAALWALPGGTPLAGLADLSLGLPGVRCTGWRPADAARGSLILALRLAQDEVPPGMVTLALALRHAGAPGAEAAPLHVEWVEAAGRRLSPGLPPAPARSAGDAPSPGFVAAVPEAAVPRLDPGGEVRLQELFAMPGGGYRHLDILVEGLGIGALSWPRLRFKFAVNGGAPQIEVRARPDWPLLFERWPGTQADEHGPFFLLSEADRGGRALGRLRSPRDRRLLDALLRLLPTLVATAARAATTDPAEYADWVAMARRFAQALLAESEGG